mmetsp:Transcript_2365/g.1498  ORF Transcript_2365/g.1498 Transcript_2365/m.1498 type:complete len:99 (-) Transcript_2365:180-476(-)
MANSTTFLLSTGKTPGIPRQIGHTWVFGDAPNFVEHAQNILVFVFSWACTSSPIIGSNFMIIPVSLMYIIHLIHHYLLVFKVNINARQDDTIKQNPIE